MLGGGRNRLFSVTTLVIIGFILLITFSYNPSLSDQTTQSLKGWTDYAKSPKAPAWMGMSKNSEAQAAIPANPLLDAESKLPSKNPDPYPFGGGQTPNTGSGTTQGGSGGTTSNGPPAVVAGGAVEKVDKPAGGPPPAVVAGGTEKLETKPAVPAAEQKPEDQKPPEGMGTPPPDKEIKGQPAPTAEVLAKYHVIRSLSIPGGYHFNITFPGYVTMNPNILPHPRTKDMYVVVSQHYPRERDFTSGWCAELACDAKFIGGNLTCVTLPQFAVIPPTTSPGLCTGDIGNLNLNIGPHDARVFMGPRFPYIIYGSQSHYTCFGQWVQDFRLTVDWGLFWNASDPFSFQTEIQRPAKYGPMEKNYFIFWGFDNQTMYAHYDSSPKRSFAKLNYDGSVGEDLAPYAYQSDEACWQKHLALNPIPTKEDTGGWKSSVHQATNSLSVTMCRRSDPSCVPSESNTYVIQIFQQKIGNGFMHARYEPYVMVFKREAPFSIHAISSKPIWIHGRASKESMIYVTSINWKGHDTFYHGFLDDPIFVNFGIEDARTASIDVLAEDLLGDLMTCA